MNQRQTLAKEYLNAILEHLKKENRIEGFAFMWLEEIVEISYLNGFNNLMTEALKLRSSSEKLGNPLAGTITNIDSSEVNTSYSWPKEKAELEKKYSYDKVVEFLRICRDSVESSLFISSPSEIKPALQSVKDDFDLETIACSLVISGHFDSAQKLIENELSEFPYRIRVVKIVMCIELFRMDKFEEALDILKEVYPEKSSSWNNLFFARGILGYEPWAGYPFSDY